MSLLNRLRRLFERERNPSPARSTGNGSALPGAKRNTTGGGPNIWPVHPDVQREIQRGSHLNMKVVVRGMRRTGKSTIVSRLCGYAPLGGYTPSPEISAGTIFYRSYAGRTGVGGGGSSGAKVELWDVVDEGFSASQPSSTARHPALADARSIDVYRGCHLAAFVVDRTRRETLEYAVREARHVPPNTCVIFILNFYDAPRDAHAVSERDIDAACTGLRRATTPMILAASAGRLPPEDYSIAATWVSISAATGQGMESLRNAFEIPYMLLKISTLEAHIHACFHFVEEHRTWMLRERANFLLQEKVNQQALREGGTEPLGAASRPLPTGGGGGAPPRDEGRGPPTLSIVAGDRLHRDVEEDENGIARDFFNDIRGDEEEDAGGAGAGAGRRRSSSGSGSSDSGHRKWMRPPTGAVVPTVSASPPPPPEPTTKLASHASHGAPATITHPAATGSAPVTVIDEDALQMRVPAAGFRDFDDNVLDVGDNQSLDGDFFGSDHSGEDSSRHSAAVATDGDGGDEGDEVRTEFSAHLRAPLAVAEASTNNVQIEPRTSSISADVSALLQQMQSMLGTSVDEEGALHVRHDKRKGQARHKRKDAARSKRRHHHVGQDDGSKGVKNTLSDDGSFEVIRE
ncbi:putative small G-protein [Trypanosoma conorhini]|uniref:Putative small G-protein n=1 Tax=Trypanosoma conorhini TaxID=83891 RepID=A0A422P2D6_9TRYP|nr:putative small G-protein [Trypanosoma conorhini]RNF11891.1 putative small G-protein [Trypanosoma conorhini]